jgi:Ni/Co efflux regulator RcnB
MFEKRLLIFTAAGALALATGLAAAQASRSNQANGRSEDQTNQAMNPAQEHGHHRRHASFDPKTLRYRGRFRTPRLRGKIAAPK